jgi:hypothetical protein
MKTRVKLFLLNMVGLMVLLVGSLRINWLNTLNWKITLLNWVWVPYMGVIAYLYGRMDGKRYWQEKQEQGILHIMHQKTKFTFKGNNQK